LRRFAVIGGAAGEDGVRDVTDGRRYPAPAVGLPPWYEFATKALLLRYIGGDGGRYTNEKVTAFKGFCMFNRQYVRSAHYGEVWDFFPGQLPASRGRGRCYY
jgi:hypothetical protein